MPTFYQFPPTFKCDEGLEDVIDEMLDTAQGLLSGPLSREEKAQIRQSVCTAWQRYISPAGSLASYALPGGLSEEQATAFAAEIGFVVEQTVTRILQKFLLERVQFELQIIRNSFEWPTSVWESQSEFSTWRRPGPDRRANQRDQRNYTRDGAKERRRADRRRSPIA